MWAKRRDVAKEFSRGGAETRRSKGRRVLRRGAEEAEIAERISGEAAFEMPTTRLAQRWNYEAASRNEPTSLLPLRLCVKPLSSPRLRASA